MDREPFEPDLNDDGTDYDTGPRWRLQPDKYGQDLPSVVIPTDPSEPPPPTQDEVKYDVGAETQTVINLLDWATDISPLSISAGWQNNAGDVSVNGLNLTENFDVAVYIKGDIKPATIYSAELLMDYEEITLHATGDDDHRNGGVGLSRRHRQQHLHRPWRVGPVRPVLRHVRHRRGDGERDHRLRGRLGQARPDRLRRPCRLRRGRPGLSGADHPGRVGDDVTVSVDGELVATLQGLADDLDTDDSGTIDAGEGLSLLDSFFVSNPTPPDPPVVNVIDGTSGDDWLVGTAGIDLISGFEGNDTMFGKESDDTLLGGDGNDVLMGDAGADF